jgi:hypothetical protein
MAAKKSQKITGQNTPGVSEVGVLIFIPEAFKCKS